MLLADEQYGNTMLTLEKIKLSAENIMLSAENTWYQLITPWENYFIS
jgi:hypothetical protein